MPEVRIHGYGGEGTVTLSELAARAALKTGKQVQSMPFFGSERRGAPVKSALRISDKEIWTYSQSYQPDILLVMNHKLLAASVNQGIKPDGIILLNAAHDIECGYKTFSIDANRICLENGLVSKGSVYANIPLCGALCALLNISASCMTDAIKEKWNNAAGEKNAQGALIAYEEMLQKINRDK